MTDVVLLDVGERIATITLNRPAARNALSSEVLRVLPKLMQEADNRDDVDVIILTGADPAFCAGLDLKELGSTAGNLRIRTSEESDGRGPFPKLSKPLIGAINGVAVTGGFELALNCDLLVASERARFGDTHTRVGVMPGWGLTVLLSQAIGVRRARLVNHVVAHEELMPFTRALALDIISNDQAGVRQIRSTYAAVTATTIADGWLVEAHDAGAWSKRGIDPAEIERRRAAIVERGHRQA